MRNISKGLPSAAILTLLLYVGCSKGTKPSTVAATIDPAQLQLFQPLRQVMPSDANTLTDEKISLGRMLYYETRLSKNQQISCNSCHQLDKYGVDGAPTSTGHKGQKGNRNSPTVYNAAAHFVQFWDGRAADVEAQAKGPLTNPVEMAMPSQKQVVGVLKSIPGYVSAFKKAFPEDKEPVTYDNMAKAIGAFERKLTTPSRWDKFLLGDQGALSNQEKSGFNVFVGTGCQTCHAGALVGGKMYRRLGFVKPWPDTSDPGREKVTQAAADRLVFKVPSLRNVERTNPYYHDGKVESLEQAVSRMAEYQLGRNLSDAQVASIVIWLKTLTGEIPSDYIKPPDLPKSTSRTPKPQVS